MIKLISSFFKNQFFFVIFAGDKFRIKSTIILGIISTSIITFLLHEQIQRVRSRPGIDENWMLRNYFTNQLNSILNGRLDVEPNAAWGECFNVKDLCYGYHGITPSLLRLPLIAAFKWQGFTDQMIVLSLVVSILSSLFVVNSLWTIFHKNFTVSSRTYSKTIFLVVLLSASLGNLAMQSALPSGYWEAIAWGYAFSILGILFTLVWYSNRIKIFLILTLISFILGANSRMTSAITAFFVGIVIIGVAWNHHNLKQRSYGFILGLSIAFIPVLSVILVFYLKFGTLLPDYFLHQQIPENPFWANIMNLNGNKTTGLIFLTSNIVAYFRPDSIIIDGTSVLFVRPTMDSYSYIWPLKKGGMYFESSSSVSSLIPIFIVMFIVFVLLNIIWWKDLKREINQPIKTDLNFLRYMVFASSACVILPLIYVGNSNRYLVDFGPAVLLILTLGCLLFDKFILNNKWSRRILPTILIIFCLYGCFLNLLLVRTLGRSF